MAKRKAVEIGQRYREARPGYLGRLSPLWIVDEVVTPAADLRGYARLSCAADSSLRKTLSIAVLADKSRFTPVDERR
jgi:hypothetical protein